VPGLRGLAHRTTAPALEEVHTAPGAGPADTGASNTPP